MFTTTQKEETKKSIAVYCGAKNITRSALAVKLNISAATLSKIENKKWDDIDDRMWRKISLFVKDVEAPVMRTADYNSCEGLCKVVQRNHYMAGLIGDTGLGKTTALMSYSMRKNVFYISYDKTMAPKHFFAFLLKEMAISFEGNIHQMVNRISDELNTLSNPLIIIDEAGKITHTMILYLHVLRDKTIKNCGIILAGMPYFKSNLLKFSNKQKEGYAEFNRRINLWQELEGLSKAEIKSICNANGIADEEVIKEKMIGKRRFGDLMNEISLYTIINQQ